jgi:cytochrome c5
MKLLFILVASSLAINASAASAPEIYADHCSICHTAGTGGAPKLGDKAEWALRIRPGMGLLYKAALEGLPNTPMMPKGGHAALADDEIKAVVDFMVAAAKLPASALKAAARYEAYGNTNRDFIRLDKSFDGFLSPRELRDDASLARGFRRFDLNGDGKLSEGEYLKAEDMLEHERGAVDVDDATLVTAIRRALESVTGLAASSVKVEAINGAVKLEAVVANADVARRAYAAIKRLQGIKTIDNRLVSGDLLTFD